LIHEGAADTGHYYAYLFNTVEAKWYKFNDINVWEVNEDKVFKDAYGL
jgi:ubiquitin carboxyl-terminal hydrolase 25/28